MSLLPTEWRSNRSTVQRLKQEVLTEEHAWTALAFVLAVAGAALGRKLLKTGWRATYGTEPPISPSTKDATWTESLLWGVITGAIIGVMRAMSRQGARSMQSRWS